MTAGQVRDLVQRVTAQREAAATVAATVRVPLAV
jgi:hypothetical protein